MFQPLWGEMPSPPVNRLGLTQVERETLCKMPSVLTLEGPKLYQPQEEQTKVKRELNMGDPLVLNTIELLRYKRQLTRLLETAEQQKAAAAEAAAAAAAGDQEQQLRVAPPPPLPPPPAMPEIRQFTRRVQTNLFGFPVKTGIIEDEEREWRLDPQPEITRMEAAEGLRKAVIRLSAQAGYQVAEESAVRILTEATQLYFQNFTHKLRSALDREREEKGGGGAGWPDILEKVCAEMGVGSVLDLQDYYEENIVSQHARLVETCKDLSFRYNQELPDAGYLVPGGGGGGGVWTDQPDEIPEMHFPSSDEGAGLGDGGLPNHATPTLDAGMQMLQSLEASGDLDTAPHSPESEVYSNMSCTTPSPSLTPRPNTASPQQTAANSRKRRRSGGKAV